MSEALSVKLEAYEGPLDLLLDLIKKNEMDILNIPMAEITQQYLDYLKQAKTMQLEIAGEFLVMAATLVLIKSKMLLPLEEETDETEGGADPRAELVQKLLEYQAFREAARELHDKANERSKTFTRNIADYYFKDLNPEDVGIDTFSANLYDLMHAFTKVIQSVDAVNFHEVFEEIVSIDQKIEEIRHILETRKQVYFAELFRERSTCNELIATFLGVLELAKQNFLDISQSKPFDDILLEKRSSEVMSTSP